MENLKKSKFIKVSDYSVMDLTDVVIMSADMMGTCLTFTFKNGTKHKENYEDFSAIDWLNKIQKELEA